MNATHDDTFLRTAWSQAQCHMSGAKTLLRELVLAALLLYFR
jgi:hypothetical protein